MTAEELWKKTGLSGSYEAWSFGGDPDGLAALVAAGIKRVVVFSDYHDTLAELFFHDAGVVLDRLPMPETKINYDLETFSSARRFEGDDEN